MQWAPNAGDPRNSANLGNTTPNPPPCAITSYGYDNVSRLTQIAQDLDGTSNDLTLGFTHNPAGQIAGTSRTNDAYAWTDHYAVNRAYTANGLNQYTASGAASLSYDSRGNLVGDGSRSFGYSSENMMVSAWPRSLIYDPFGRLVQLDTAAGFDRFGYDGASLIVEYDGSNAVARRYVHGPGIDEPLVWYENGARRYLHADEMGSVVAVSDGAGAMLGVNTYDEYGIPGSANSGRFQYTGQAWLPELGMYYYRARIHSPTLGRFMQSDPIGYAGGLKLYAYVLNDPVNLVDPMGLEQTCYQHITRGWTDRSDPDFPVVSAMRVREVCLNHHSAEQIPGGSNVIARTSPQPPPTPACQAAVNAGLVYFGSLFAAREGTEAANALNAWRAARTGAVVGSRAG